MAHEQQGQHWRTLGKNKNFRSRDKSTDEITGKLGTPRTRDVTESHSGVASVGVGGAKPTMPKCDDGNCAANAKFNNATKGPRERGNVVMVSGR